MATSFSNSRTEMAAVLEAKRSILSHTELTPAMPDVDLGIDLIAFQKSPFRAYPVQVKGTTSGFMVWEAYSLEPTVLVYVLNPLGENPETFVMTGAEAWSVPATYVERGGRAADYRPGEIWHYRMPSITVLLLSILREQYSDSQANWTRILLALKEPITAAA
jgi:hypothetical protein